MMMYQDDSRSFKIQKELTAFDCDKNLKEVGRSLLILLEL